MLLNWTVAEHSIAMTSVRRRTYSSAAYRAILRDRWLGACRYV